MCTFQGLDKFDLLAQFAAAAWNQIAVKESEKITIVNGENGA